MNKIKKFYDRRSNNAIGLFVPRNVDKTTLLNNICGECFEYVFLPEEFKGKEYEVMLQACIYSLGRKFGEIMYY